MLLAILNFNCWLSRYAIGFEDCLVIMGLVCPLTKFVFKLANGLNPGVSVACVVSLFG